MNNQIFKLYCIFVDQVTEFVTACCTFLILYQYVYSIISFIVAFFICLQSVASFGHCFSFYCMAGSVLIHWLSNRLDTAHQMADVLTEVDRLALLSQFLTNLMAIGVLRQLDDPSSLREHVFSVSRYAACIFRNAYQ